MPDGRIGHSELELDSARFMMADAHREIQSPAPEIGVGSPMPLPMTVDDVDATVESARSAGALVDRELAENPGVGRVSVIRDPFAHRWFLNQPDD